MHSVEEPPIERESRARQRSAGRGISIRTRILAIALIPCAALLFTGSVALTFLARDAREAIEWSNYLDRHVDLLVDFVTAIQNERALSLAVLNRDQTSIPKLQAQRSRTDAALFEINQAAPEAQRVAPDATGTDPQVFTDLITGIPMMRQSVDLGETDTRSVEEFYGRLAEVFRTGLQGLAQVTPDALTAAGELTAANLLSIAELHSRAVGVGSAGTVDGRPLTNEERRTFTQLVGGYRHQLEGVTPQLSAESRTRLERLARGREWTTATEAEDVLADRGTVDVPDADWQAAERVVDAELLGLFQDQLDYANSQASTAATRSLHRSIAAGVGVAAIAIITFLLALTLANRLVRRLHALHSRTLELANEIMPVLVQRIREGEKVDVTAETAMLDAATDEIGQVAEAFGVAHRTAMVAAAAEARTREGFKRVFLDIAHRSQVLVRRQLDVLDIAEAKQQDPEQLELLFQLDHLATRARRNAENLLLLGDGRPGRRWPDPIALDQVVRSAFSETKDLTRMSAIRLPDVQVIGAVVADLIHLLAELIDNAMHFSPPQSVVSVHGNRVGRGVVIEIEDQGLGIGVTERERLNRLLRNPPEFQEMALAGQRHLGLFVISRLAERHGITVNLQESAYGGVKAIVLIQSNLLAAVVDDEADEPPSLQRPGVREAIGTRMSKRIERAPEPFGYDSAQAPPWPGAEEHTAAHGLGHEALGVAVSEPAAIRGASVRRGTPTPLPRRRRQTHLAPELRRQDEQSDRAEQHPLEHRRAGDDVRRAMASFQRGTAQARHLQPPTNT